MKRPTLLLTVLMCFYSISSFALEKSIHVGTFGAVMLYAGSDHPSRMAVLISGDEGWNPAMADLARGIAAKDALVAGVDFVRYMKSLNANKGKCLYPAGDLEELAKEAQKAINLPHYIPPMLIGFSSGAALAYASQVQAPSSTFSGAITIGFCPDLAAARPLCKNYGLQSAPTKAKGYRFLPAKNLETPWVALQGSADQVCTAAATADFVKQVPHAELVAIPKADHRYATQQDFLPQLTAAMDRILGSVQTAPKTEKPITGSEVNDLPLKQVPAKSGSSTSLAVIVTGDGGWASIDKSIGESLADAGISVVGFDCLQYFWTRRDPDTASADLQRVVRHYLVDWKKDSVIMVGYSFGADVLPAMVSRFPAEVRSKIKLITLLTPGYTADFEFHLTDWLGGTKHPTEQPILPEIQKLKGTKILCIYGDDDQNTLCRTLKPEQAVVVQVHGGHHYGGDYKALAARILKEAQ